MKQRFTLIELIVSIVVISILVAIVIPNVSSSKEDATIVAIRTDIRNLQVAVDSYALRHSEALPISGEVSRGMPQPINFSALHPDHIRNLPKTPDMKYWIDYLGVVYASTADAPTEVRMQGEDLLWNPSKNAKGYRIFTAETSLVQSSINAQDFKLVAEKKAQEKTTLKMLRPLPEGHTYYISAIDRYGLETPAVKSGYTGYLNQKPVAVLNIDDLLLDSKPLTPNSSQSIDPDNGRIVAEEWRVNHGPASPTFPTTKFSAGEHFIELRVKDENGLWSDWVSKTISVKVDNNKPVTTIKMTPNTNITSLTNIMWTHTSTDPDGDAIVEVQWMFNGVLTSNPNGKRPIGSHKMELRVKDARGMWSNWVRHDFSVGSPQFYLSYDKEYGIFDGVRSTYGGPSSGVTLKVRGVSDMTGIRVRINAAQSGATWALPHTPGYYFTSTGNHIRGDVTLTLGKDGISNRFQYTDSWLRIYSITLLN